MSAWVRGWCGWKICVCHVGYVCLQNFGVGGLGRNFGFGTFVDMFFYYIFRVDNLKAFQFHHFLC